MATGLLAATVIVSTRIARSQQPDDADPAAAIGVAVEAGIRGRGVLHNARVGVSIIDITTGQTIYERDPDGRYNAASNAKLTTMAAALSQLGPDFQYETTIYADQWDRSSTVKGDLFVVGRGDPSLDNEALARLVSQLQRAGITRVTGGLVVDDSYFDGEVLPPHFDEQPDEQKSFRAPVSALSLNFNAVAAVVRPGTGSGAPAVITLDPDNDYVTIVNNVSTIKTGRTRLHVKLTEHRNSIEMKLVGRIRTDSTPRRVRRRITHPFEYFGSVLRQVVAHHGIHLGNRTAKRGSPPPSATPLASGTSQPLGVLVRGPGKFSNNFMAEAIFKTVGAESLNDVRPATWADAQLATKQFLVQTVGLPDGSFRVDNGSGLFASNELSPRQIATVLRVAYRDFRYGPEYVSSLAFAAADGTLSERMAEGPGERQVRAKTGTLSTVSALSGYVAVDGTRPLAFSILVNDIPKRSGSLSAARSLQDDIAEALVIYLRTPR